MELMISVNGIPKQSFTATKDLDRSLAKRVVLLVGKRLQWGHDNTISCANSQRIEVLHVTYGVTSLSQPHTRLRSKDLDIVLLKRFCAVHLDRTVKRNPERAKRPRFCE